MYQSGVKEIIIVSRTQANAEKIVNEFSSTFHSRVMPTFWDLDINPDIIIRMTPADVTSVTDFRVSFESACERGLCICCK